MHTQRDSMVQRRRTRPLFLWHVGQRYVLSAKRSRADNIVRATHSDTQTTGIAGAGFSVKALHSCSYEQ